MDTDEHGWGKAIQQEGTEQTEGKVNRETCELRERELGKYFSALRSPTAKASFCFFPALLTPTKRTASMAASEMTIPAIINEFDEG